MHDLDTAPPASAALPDQVLPLGSAELMAWVVNATPGDRAIYWRGHVARDMWHGWAGGMRRRDCNALGETARLAFRLAERGFLRLVQHRIGPHDYAYVAIALGMSPARPAPQVVA